MKRSIECAALTVLAFAAQWSLLFFLSQPVTAQQQVSGPPIATCPPGQMLVQVSLGQQVISRQCMSAAELERAAYRTSAKVGEGEVVCRTLLIRFEEKK